MDDVFVFLRNQSFPYYEYEYSAEYLTDSRAT